MLNTISRQKGLGLLETMITVAVIAIALMALIRLQTNITYGNSVSQQHNTALLLGMNQLETLRDFVALTGTTSYQSIATGSSTYNSTSATYTITWTVTTLTNPNYKNIDVSVSWTDRNGINQAIRLVSRVAGLDPAYSSTIMG